MQFMKMATVCLTAVVAFGGFFVVAAVTSVEEKKKMEHVDKTLDTATASG